MELPLENRAAEVFLGLDMLSKIMLFPWTRSVVLPAITVT